MSPDPGSAARRELNTKNSGVAKRRAGQWVIRSVKEICRILLLKMEREERCAVLEKNQSCGVLWTRLLCSLYFTPILFALPGDRTPNLTTITVTTNYYTPYPM